MLELRAILDKLIEALSLFKEKNDSLDKKSKECEAKDVRTTEREIALKEKTDDINTREAKVVVFENIELAKEDAKKVSADAEASKISVEKVKANLTAEIKQFHIDKAGARKELDDGRLMNKKQADALIEERKVFEAKLTAFRAMSAAIK